MTLGPYLPGSEASVVIQIVEGCRPPVFGTGLTVRASVQKRLAGFTVVGLATYFRASFTAHGVGILAKFAKSGLSWFRPTTSPSG